MGRAVGFKTVRWDTWDMSLEIPELWDGGIQAGRTVGFRHCVVGHCGHVWLVILGLWDGKDSGIQVLYSGTLGICLGCLYIVIPGLWISIV